MDGCELKRIVKNYNRESATALTQKLSLKTLVPFCEDRPSCACESEKELHPCINLAGTSHQGVIFLATIDKNSINNSEENDVRLLVGINWSQGTEFLNKYKKQSLEVRSGMYRKQIRQEIGDGIFVIFNIFPWITLYEWARISPKQELIQEWGFADWREKVWELAVQTKAKTVVFHGKAAVWDSVEEWKIYAKERGLLCKIYKATNLMWQHTSNFSIHECL